MINTVSDLLLELKNKEVELLKKYNILKHPGLIGNMYEGLTKHLLNKAIFNGLDIRICSGKIKNFQTNSFTDEIDCMIVFGEGEKIPHTDKFIYDSKNVIAVIQVKKNLFSKDIKDSYENLRSVIKATELSHGKEYHMNLLRGAYTQLFQEELPRRSELDSIPIEKQMIYHTLLLEAVYPIRIVWGYNGFKSEFSLRESFISFLKDNLSNGITQKAGFSPLNFPNLIICDNYSLVKTNGMPFVYPIIAEKWWLLYASTYENPVYQLLEILWTRLEVMFNLSPNIYGEDLKIDQMHGFIACKYLELNGLKGWEYNYIEASDEKLKIPLTHKDWEPVFLNHVQFITISTLCLKPINFLEDDDFIKLVNTTGQSMQYFLNEIKNTGLVQVKNNCLELITEECSCGVTNDGKFFAGENKTGRVTRWIMNQIKKSDI